MSKVVGKNIQKSYGSETARIALATVAGIGVAAALGSTSQQGAWVNVVYDLLVLSVGSVALLRLFCPKEADSLLKALQGVGPRSVARNSVGIKAYEANSASTSAPQRRNGSLDQQQQQQLPTMQKLVRVAAAARVAASAKDVPIETVEVKTMRLQKEYPGLSLETDIHTLLRHGMPTNKSDPAMRFILGTCRDVLKQSGIVEGEVVGFPMTSLVDNEDVPSFEVNLCINADMQALAARLEQWSQRQQRGRIPNDRKNLTLLKPKERAKKALRVCTDLFIKSGFFLYHYCVYNADIPKVSLRVPAFHADTNRDVFVNLFLNNPYVERQEEVSNECARMTQYGAHLAFFVRRWARDRGIAFAIKGHFSAYTWTVLVLYFLQQRQGGVKNESEGAGAFVSQTFEEFINFYMERFQNSDHSIAPEMPKCSKDDTENGSARLASVLPRVVDPFDTSAGADLGSAMSADTISRLWEELRRASELLADRSKVTLAELLKHWVPPEQAS